MACLSILDIDRVVPRASRPLVPEITLANERTVSHLSTKRPVIFVTLAVMGVVLLSDFGG